MDVVTLPEPPPLMLVSVVRRWQFGLVMLADPALGKVVQDFNASDVVTATAEGLVVEVLTGGPLDEGEEEADGWEFRKVAFHLAVGSSAVVRGVVGERPVLFDGVIETPSGSVVLDDGETPGVRVPAFPDRTRVLVSAPGDGSQATEVWIDLLPA